MRGQREGNTENQNQWEGEQNRVMGAGWSIMSNADVGRVSAEWPTNWRERMGNARTKWWEVHNVKCRHGQSFCRVANVSKVADKKRLGGRGLFWFIWWRGKCLPLWEGTGGGVGFMAGVCGRNSSHLDWQGARKRKCWCSPGFFLSSFLLCLGILPMQWCQPPRLNLSGNVLKDISKEGYTRWL